MRRGYLVAIAFCLGGLTASLACKHSTAPREQVCPVLSDVDLLPGSTVHTWAYFRHDSAGPTYAATLVYDNPGFRPPCLRFTP